MNRAQKILQAYRNTPWRRQTQMLSRLVAAGVVIAFVLMVYTWMSSQAGAYGLNVQKYQRTALAVEQNIEHKRAQLADITSNEALAERAAKMGYIPVDPNRIRYLEVESYYTDPPLQLAPPPNAVHQRVEEDPGLPPEFTTSLIEWIQQVINNLGSQTPGGN